ncbi:FkbM family methyltransferase [Jannaschia ovalis]|uniref:FkbM family methyltransferase n=1 Tax=Jannaschia ovalis TaxID=3038773 RepID=A0ABY8L723_9RHOB|nr:FkbM family methyltransferase [Jannaschia sp. GRR-S6-38]WGH77184.1 FkbM family methyltransferase [Jannaschia sp. GRR-S6-38]
MAMPDKMQARYFRRYGFEAHTIIDVGVLNGTPFLYDCFPDRHFVMIDPLEESRAAVAENWGHLDHEFHVCALGAQPGLMELQVEAGRLARSSFRARRDGGTPAERRRVQVRRLDDLVASHAGPLGLKIDTEGAELEVLRGATATLRRCEFVITETSIKKRFVDGYRFSEVIAFMAEQGFEVYSFLSGLTRAPRMADVLFIPADSPRFDMGRNRNADAQAA